MRWFIYKSCRDESETKANMGQPVTTTTRTTTTTTTTTPTTTTSEPWFFDAFHFDRPMAVIIIGSISVVHSLCHVPHMLMYRRLGMITAFWSLVGLGLVVGAAIESELMYDVWIWYSCVYLPVMLVTMAVVLGGAVFAKDLNPLRIIFAAVAVIFYLFMFYCIVFVMDQKRTLFSTTTTTTTTTTLPPCPTCLECTTLECTTETCSTAPPPLPKIIVVYKTYPPPTKKWWRKRAGGGEGGDPLLRHLGRRF